MEIVIQGPVTEVAFCRVPVPVQLMVRLPPPAWAMPKVTQLTVTVNVHFSTVPAALLAVQETSVTPGGKRLPEGGVLIRVKLVLHMPTW